MTLPDGTVSHKAPLGFWKFHQALEAQHADHTMDELEEAYAAGRITDEAKFEEAANAMLDACKVFWDGLDADRKGEEFVLTDEQTDRFAFVADEQSEGVSSALSALAPGQNVLLSWDHEYVTRSETVDGRETSSSSPERIVTKLAPDP